MNKLSFFLVLSLSVLPGCSVLEDVVQRSADKADGPDKNGGTDVDAGDGSDDSDDPVSQGINAQDIPTLDISVEFYMQTTHIDVGDYDDCTYYVCYTDPALGCDDTSIKDFVEKCELNEHYIYEEDFLKHHLKKGDVFKTDEEHAFEVISGEVVSGVIFSQCCVYLDCDEEFSQSDKRYVLVKRYRIKQDDSEENW